MRASSRRAATGRGAGSRRPVLPAKGNGTGFEDALDVLVVPGIVRVLFAGRVAQW